MIKEVLKENHCSASPELMLSQCCKKHDKGYETKGKFKAGWECLECGWETANAYDKWYKRAGVRFVSTFYFTMVALFGVYAYYKTNKRLF